MPFKQAVGAMGGVSTSAQTALQRELQLLRDELDDMRAKYTAMRALLVAATAVGAGYGTGTALNPSVFTAS